MARIHTMNEHLTNMIAAGEVVERPMGIVKECVENSIDAKASSIEVRIINGGLDCITIIDDGIGMDFEDARMAFERHATSKIQKDEDLWNIHTLGFRGEALPSIASVAAVDLLTSDGTSSTKVQVHYGKQLMHERFAAPKGTQIDIRDLFQRTPARFKHLKSPQYEFSLISDVIQKFAFANPDIAFRLAHNDVETFRTNGSGNLQEVLMQIYGRDLAKSAIRIENSDADYTISGYAAQPNFNRATKYYMLIYINKRMVRSMRLQKAIQDAYAPYLPSDRFPIVVLNIEMDAQLVDVNVHPSKWEIRLSKEKQCENLIYLSLSEGLKKALQVSEVKTVKEKVIAEMPKFDFDEKKEQSVQLNKELANSFEMNEAEAYPIYTADFTKNEAQSKPIVPKDSAPKPVQPMLKESASIFVPLQQFAKKAEPVQIEPVSKPLPEPEKDACIPSQEDLVKQVDKVNESFPELTVIGQFHNCYILASGEKGLYVIDQHAAQEKYHYEQLKKNIFAKDVMMQQLLIPETIKLTPAAIVQLEDINAMLSPMHIELELFGEDSVILREIPLWLKNTNLNYFVHDLVDLFLKNNEISEAKLRKSALASLACHSSIRFNRALTMDEMRQVIEDLKKCEQPFHCPHGRPTMICITDAQLEKDFYRVG